MGRRGGGGHHMVRNHFYMFISFMLTNLANWKSAIKVEFDYKIKMSLAAPTFTVAQYVVSLLAMFPIVISCTTVKLNLLNLPSGVMSGILRISHIVVHLVLG